MENITVTTLRYFRKIYQESYNKHPSSPGARLYQDCHDCFYNNNTPVNLLKVLNILKNCNYLLNLSKLTSKEYSIILNDMSKLSGYSVKELKSKLKEI